MNDDRYVVLGAADSWYVRDLRRAAEDQVELSCAAFSQIQVEQTGRKAEAQILSGETRLDAFDAVLVRTMPPGSLEQVVFRMDALAALQSQGVVVSNPPKAIEAAVDKFLCNALLAQQGIATPPTLTCQSFEPAMEAFHRFGGDVVVKPIFGGEGRGLMRLDDEGLAHRALRTLIQLNAVLYLQPFMPHQSDLRLFRIGERVVGMRRDRHEDWRTNISQGGRASPLEVNDRLADLAVRASDAIGADIAGVDVILDAEQQPIVIEVNAVPGWRALQRVTGQDIAKMILQHVGDLVRAGRTRRDAVLLDSEQT